RSQHGRGQRVSMQMRIADLVERYLEGTLDSQGRQELLGRLRTDVEVRRSFLEQLDFVNLVSELYRAEDFTVNTVDRIRWTTRMHAVPEVRRSTRRTCRRPSSERTPSWLSWAVGAAAILTIVAIILFLSPEESDPGRGTRSRTSKGSPSRTIAE